MVGAVQREANQLVEEFMLLANMSMARVMTAAFFDKLCLGIAHRDPKVAAPGFFTS